MGLILKPRMGTMLDRLHPLARGLEHAFIFNEFEGLTAFDLVQHRACPVVGTTSQIGWFTRVSDNGAGFKGDALAAFNFSPKFDKANGEPWSLVLKWLPDNNIEYIAIGHYDSGAWDSNNYLYNSSTRLRIKDRDGTENNYTSLGSNTGTQWYQATISVSADDIKIYKNGVLWDSGVSSSLGILFDMVGTGYNSTTYCLDGLISYAYFYDRTLSAAEAMRIYFDPYAMLEQQQPELWEYYAGIPAEGPTMPIFDYYYNQSRL